MQVGCADAAEQATGQAHVQAGLAIVLVTSESTASYRREWRWHVQRCRHFIAILTQMMSISRILVTIID